MQFSSLQYAIHEPPSYNILLDLITPITYGEQYRSLSSSLCSFLHSPVTSSLLGPNILLSTLFSNTLLLRSSLTVSDQVSHPYKKSGKIYTTVLSSCLHSWIANSQTNVSAPHDGKHSLTLKPLLLISSRM